MGTEFEGSRHVQDWVARPLELSKLVNHIVGATETLITRPGDEKILVLSGLGGLSTTFDIRPGDYTLKPFAGDNTGGVEEDIIITGSAHNLTTGDGPYKLTKGVGALPAGLDDFVTQYFVRVVNATTLTLHLSRAAAVANTARVDLVDDGAGSDHDLAGMPTGMTLPSSPGNTDGYASTRFDGSVIPGLPASGLILAAPTLLTVKGSGAGSRLAYWFLP